MNALTQCVMGMVIWLIPKARVWSWMKMATTRWCMVRGNMVKKAKWWCLCVITLSYTNKCNNSTWWMLMVVNSSTCSSKIRICHLNNSNNYNNYLPQRDSVDKPHNWKLLMGIPTSSRLTTTLKAMPCNKAASSSTWWIISRNYTLVRMMKKNF